MASNDNDLTICADSYRVLAYKLKMSKISLIADIFNDDTKEKKIYIELLLSIDGQFIILRATDRSEL